MGCWRLRLRDRPVTTYSTTQKYNTKVTSLTKQQTTLHIGPCMHHATCTHGRPQGLKGEEGRLGARPSPGKKISMWGGGGGDLFSPYGGRFSPCGGSLFLLCKAFLGLPSTLQKFLCAPMHTPCYMYIAQHGTNSRIIKGPFLPLIYLLQISYNNNINSKITIVNTCRNYYRVKTSQYQCAPAH